MSGEHRPEIIFFDAAGTLLEVRGSVGAIYADFARRYGVELDPAAIQRGFVHHFSQQPPLAFSAGNSEAGLRRLEYEWWRALVGQVVGADFAPVEQFEPFFAAVFEFFRGRAAWRVYDDVAPALAALRARGLRLAVLSNFDSRLEDLLRAFALDHYFEAVHISSRLGAAKPDPAIFQAALQFHGLSPRQALHVGDSLREDVAGAQAAGVRAYLIDRSSRETPGSTPIRLFSLRQLLTDVTHDRG